MATIFKRSGEGNWIIQWFGADGKRRTKNSRTTDSRTAKRIADDLEAKVALRREGIVDPRAEEIRDQSERPILKVVAKGAGKTDEGVLADYEASLKAKGTSQTHIDENRSKIEKIVAFTGYQKLSDIRADGVNRYAADMRTRNAALRTIASHLQAIKGFTRWAVTTEKLHSDSLVSVKKPSAEEDPRRVRRFLTLGEWNWLDFTTRASVERFGMLGVERALLYATAIQTGLRSSELASLTRGKLHLSVEPPYVIADAGKTKNGKAARQYVLPVLSRDLKELARTKLAGARVFNMPRACRVCSMFREDLERARAAWLSTIADPQERIECDQSDFLRIKNSEGDILDFHALRHTTASWLIHAGADVKTVQTVMRHADIKLTLQTYGHLFPGAEADAIGKLHALFDQPWDDRATGTLGALHLAQQSGRFAVRSVAIPCEVGDSNDAYAQRVFTAEKLGERTQIQGNDTNGYSGTLSYDKRSYNPYRTRYSL